MSNKSLNFGPCTWNFEQDPPDLPAILSKLPLKSYAAQIETAPTTGTRHWQFFIRTRSVAPFDRVRGWFPGAHIEITKRPLDAWNYCCDTTKEGASNTITMGDPPPAGSGARTDIAAAAQLVLTDGIRAVHEQMPETAVRYSHHLQRHASILRKHAHLPLKIREGVWPEITDDWGEIRKVRGEWQFDDVLDKKIAFHVGAISHDDKLLLSRPYNYLMSCKGSTYPRKFTELVIMQPRLGQDPSITLPQPLVTPGQRWAEQRALERAAIDPISATNYPKYLEEVAKWEQRWDLQSSRHTKDVQVDGQSKKRKRCRTPDDTDPAVRAAMVAVLGPQLGAAACHSARV